MHHIIPILTILCVQRVSQSFRYVIYFISNSVTLRKLSQNILFLLRKVQLLFLINKDFYRANTNPQWVVTPREKKIVQPLHPVCDRTGILKLFQIFYKLTRNSYLLTRGINDCVSIVTSYFFNLKSVSLNIGIALNL